MGYRFLMYFKFGRYKIDGEFAENIIDNKGDNMDGNYIELSDEEGNKTFFEIAGKISSKESRCLAGKIETIKHELQFYTNAKDNAELEGNTLNFTRFSERAEGLKIALKILE